MTAIPTLLLSREGTSPSARPPSGSPSSARDPGHPRHDDRTTQWRRLPGCGCKALLANQPVLLQQQVSGLELLVDSQGTNHSHGGGQQGSRLLRCTILSVKYPGGRHSGAALGHFWAHKETGGLHCPTHLPPSTFPPSTLSIPMSPVSIRRLSGLSAPPDAC